MLADGTPRFFSSGQRHGARSSPECTPPHPWIGIRVFNETERCEQPATFRAHPSSHGVSNCPLKILRDDDRLQGRLVRAQTRWMELMCFPSPMVTSWERLHETECKPSPFVNVSPFETINDSGLRGSFLYDGDRRNLKKTLLQLTSCQNTDLAPGWPRSC